MREGESVDIEVDSGAEVSCLLTRIHCTNRGSSCVEVITLRRGAANCMSSVARILGWKLVMCEVTL